MSTLEATTERQWLVKPRRAGVKVGYLRVEKLEAGSTVTVRCKGRGCAFDNARLNQGEPGDRVLILLEGHVKASFVDPDGREVVLSVRGPGDILGKLSSSHHESRSSSVTAIEPVVRCLDAHARSSP